MAGGKAPRDIGKVFEARIAKAINGKRSGYGNLDKPDVENNAFAIECKVRPLPVTLEEALQTVKARGSDKKLQMVVIKRKGALMSEARVYLSFNDFLEWYG